MSDIINALTSAPHGATHIGFYGDDIIFIKEHEEARSDAWGIESTQWQEIEDFDVSLIYGVRAIKDVKIEAELLKQIEQIKAERDALAKEVDAANDRNAELTEDRDALAAQVERLQYYITKYQELGAEFILTEALTKTPRQCLRDIQAEAGRVGYFEAAMNYDPDYDPWWSADQYAESVRQGGAE